MDGKIFPAPQRDAAPSEAGDGAGLDVFNTLPIFAHACACVWALERPRNSMSSYLNWISGQFGMEGCGVGLIIQQLPLAAAQRQVIMPHHFVCCGGGCVNAHQQRDACR